MADAANQPKILAFAGSTREGSHNKRLIRIAAEAARAAGADVTLIDLRDYPMPPYDGDLEAQGLPASVVALKELFKAHDGFLISAPEYNGGMSGMLKNTIDWVSRRGDDDRPLAAFSSKFAGLMAASPGALGGVRGLGQLRHVLTTVGVLVVPQQRGIAAGDQCGAQGVRRERPAEGPGAAGGDRGDRRAAGRPHPAPRRLRSLRQGMVSAGSM